MWLASAAARKDSTECTARITPSGNRARMAGLSCIYLKYMLWDVLVGPVWKPAMVGECIVDHGGWRNFIWGTSFRNSQMLLDVSKIAVNGKKQNKKKTPILKPTHCSNTFAGFFTVLCVLSGHTTLKIVYLEVDLLDSSVLVLDAYICSMKGSKYLKNWYQWVLVVANQMNMWPLQTF